MVKAGAPHSDSKGSCEAWLEAGRRGLLYKAYRQLVELPVTAHQVC